MIYLVKKYDKNDAVYSKVSQKQELINQRLYFDMGTLYKSFAEHFYPHNLASTSINTRKR